MQSLLPEAVERPVRTSEGKFYSDSFKDIENDIDMAKAVIIGPGIDKGEEVIIVDNLETGHEDAIHPKAKFYKVDIRDEKSLNKVFEENKIDEVIHFAANSLVGESMTNPLK